MFHTTACYTSSTKRASFLKVNENGAKKRLPNISCFFPCGTFLNVFFLLLARFSQRNLCDGTERSSSVSKNDVLERLRAKINVSGPLSVAQYMREVLTSPFSGYYMAGDVFGSKGDFTTSPEISQIFGELLAVWCLDQWVKMGSPVPLQIVELGPGRGTLAEDVLRVFSQFLSVSKDLLSLHLVEVSPALRNIQLDRLCGGVVAESAIWNPDGPVCFEAVTRNGFPVVWHPQLRDVPCGFSIFVAHEFFDVLPIHKFQKTSNGWREVLIDINDEKDSKHLRYVLSRNPTPASIAYVDKDAASDHFEVSPESGVLVQELSTRIVENGGVALIADYGEERNGRDTLRAFRKHELHDPLSDPGTVDLTADVDFSYLREMAVKRTDVLTYGPIAQRTFLRNLGIEMRLEKLQQKCDPSISAQLQSGCEMLTDPNKMGERFKFFAIYPAVMKPFFSKFPPSGFFSQ